MNTFEVLRVLYPLLQRELKGESPLEIYASMAALQRWQSSRRRHSVLPGVAAFPNSRMDADFIGVMYRMCRFATATYGWRGALFFYLTEPQASYGFDSTASVLRAAISGDAASFCRHAGIDREHLLYESGPAALGIPKHFIAVDDDAEAVVLAIRGTMSINDALTDLLARHVEFAHGEAHEGIAHAAHAVYAATVGVLRDELVKRPGYKLIITGHSLGAATSILFTILLFHIRHQQMKDARIPPDMVPFAGVEVQCFAYAPPPVFAPLDVLPDDVQRSIVSCVHNEDFISRLSLHSMRDLIRILRKIKERVPSIGSRIMGPGGFTAGLWSPIVDAAMEAEHDRAIDAVLQTEPEWLQSFTGKEAGPVEESPAATTGRRASTAASPAPNGATSAGAAAPVGKTAAERSPALEAQLAQLSAAATEARMKGMPRLPEEGEEHSRLQIPGIVYCVRPPVDIGASAALEDQSRDPAASSTSGTGLTAGVADALARPLDLINSIADGVSSTAASVAGSVFGALGLSPPPAPAPPVKAYEELEKARDSRAGSADLSSHLHHQAGADVVRRRVVKNGAGEPSPLRRKSDTTPDSTPKAGSSTPKDETPRPAADVPEPSAGNPYHESTDEVQLDEGVAAEATQRAQHEQLPYVTVAEPPQLRNLPVTDSAWRDHVPDMYLNALRQLKEVADRQRGESRPARVSTSVVFRRHFAGMTVDGVAGSISAHSQEVGSPKSPVSEGAGALPSASAHAAPLSTGLAPAADATPPTPKRAGAPSAATGSAEEM